MGCSSSSQDRTFVVYPSNGYHIDIEKRLLPLLNIAHAANINSKYMHITELYPDRYSNTGIYKTNAYKSLVSKEELDKYRREFWGKFIRNESRWSARSMERSEIGLRES